MLDARFRPMPVWTRKPALELAPRSQFRTAYARTLDLLEYELRKLNARDIIIEAGFTLDQIRNDGWPKAGFTPKHPGVVLYFKSADGSMEFPCASYDRMEHNLHAIALTLQNLRAIDRHGVTLGHQQYLGFLALAAAPAQMTVEQAAEFIASTTGSFSANVIIQNEEAYRRAYRTAAARLHPDVTGSNDGFYKLGNAEGILNRHHKEKQRCV